MNPDTPIRGQRKGRWFDPRGEAGGRQLTSMVTAPPEAIRMTFEGLAPAIDQFPPTQAQPFVNIHFGPLAMLPPVGTEFTRVRCSCDAVNKVRHLFFESTEGTPGVEVRSHQQNTPCPRLSQAKQSVLSFRFSGQAVNRANCDQLRLRQASNIFPRQF
jgi:hypothetical protein